MKTLQSTTIILYIALSSCVSSNTTKDLTPEPGKKVYAKEPSDSSSYRQVKFDFYVNTRGELFERKLAMARDSNSESEFEVYYDSTFTFFMDDFTIVKPLSSVIDINTFSLIDSTEYSKDKNNVYYFHSNSDGGKRDIVDKADPATFKRLGDYRWGIDKNHVFYKDNLLDGLNIKTVRVLFPTDTADPFIEYVKDNKHVYWESELVIGADAKTFKVVANQQWEAEDKNHKYKTGRSQE